MYSFRRMETLILSCFMNFDLDFHHLGLYSFYWAWCWMNHLGFNRRTFWPVALHQRSQPPFVVLDDTEVDGWCPVFVVFILILFWAGLLLIEWLKPVAKIVDSMTHIHSECLSCLSNQFLWLDLGSFGLAQAMAPSCLDILFQKLDIENYRIFLVVHTVYIFPLRANGPICYWNPVYSDTRPSSAFHYQR